MSGLPKVYVSRPLPTEAMAPIEGRAEVGVGPATGTLERGAFLERVSTCDALVAMLTDKLDREALGHFPRLKIVANYAVGYNNVDCEAAAELGIWVTNTPDAVTDATAECALGLMLSVARRIPEADQFLRAGKFEGWTPTHFIGTQLLGSTLGIIGLGRIGQAVARRAQAFGMRVVYTDLRRSPEAAALGADFLPFDELLATADFVSVHCPLSETTRHRVDAAALAKMKRTAFLINTARGPIVDEGALAQALHDGRIAGAGLDVFEEEPKVHPLLLSAPHTVLVPHIGTSTLRTRVAMAELALGDVLRVLRGERPVHPVNQPRVPRR